MVFILLYNRKYFLLLEYLSSNFCSHIIAGTYYIGNIMDDYTLLKNYLIEEKTFIWTVTVYNKQLGYSCLLSRFPTGIPQSSFYFDGMLQSIVSVTHCNRTPYIHKSDYESLSLVICRITPMLLMKDLNTYFFHTLYIFAKASTVFLKYLTKYIRCHSLNLNE